MTTDVIIPALNEESTIGPIIGVFKEHPKIGHVHVMVDDNSDDLTANIVRQMSAHNSKVHYWRMVGVSGKGQLVQWAAVLADTSRVVLCDADYTRFNSYCVDMVLTDHSVMRVCVPREPTRGEWIGKGIPGIPWSTMLKSWPVNSGFRSLPTELLYDHEFHGYLLETQLNKLAEKQGIPVQYIPLGDNLRAPLRFTKRRLEAMENDRVWGHVNGVFGA